MNKLIITLDSQSLTALQKCEQLWDFSFHKGYTYREIPEPFKKGNIIHNALYIFYKCKMHHRPYKKCQQRAIQYLKLVAHQLEPDTFLLLCKKILQYIEYYRREPYQPLALEEGFSKILYEDAYYLFIYEGRIDMVFSIQGEPKPAWSDTKTESQKDDLNQMSNQFLGYSWALGTNTGIINYFGLQESYTPDKAFRRTIVAHRNDQIEDWKQNTIHWYFRLASILQHGKVLKNRNSCKLARQHYPCLFYDVCRQTNPRLINQLLETDFTKKEWKAWK